MMIPFIKVAIVAVLESMIKEDMPTLLKHMDKFGVDKSDLLVLLIELGDPSPETIQRLET